MRSLRVLVACEESQRVCTAFRELGHEAYSCDIIKPSGGHPEWHIRGDVLKVLNPRKIHVQRSFECWDQDGIKFDTMDKKDHIVDKWDLIIAHPPCTYLTSVATRFHSLKTTPLEQINMRTMRRIEAMEFFMAFANASCEHIAIENPRGVMNTTYRQPDQIIDPYMFAESVDDSENYVTKSTCLWLKGLPLLVGNDLQKPDNEMIYGKNPNGKVSNWEERVVGKDRSKTRSKTFPGIARAMAEQWGGYLAGGVLNQNDPQTQ